MFSFVAKARWISLNKNFLHMYKIFCNNTLWMSTTVVGVKPCLCLKGHNIGNIGLKRMIDVFFFWILLVFEIFIIMFLQPCVEIVCYQRCHSSIAAVGNNEIAEWRQDSSMLAVSVCTNFAFDKLLFCKYLYRVIYNQLLYDCE